MIKRPKTRNWAVALANPAFKWRLITGLAIFVCLIGSLPFFFAYIQQRQGIVLQDLVLQHITARNASVPLFATIWLTGALIALRAIFSPAIFLNFLWTAIFLVAFRDITLTFVALNPPPGLVALADPLVNKFYGKAVITKDLFFSGHTCFMFVIFLCLEKRFDKIWALCATLLVGVLVLVQHVHYTVDVVAAPVFGYLSFYLATRVTKKALRPDLAKS